jgi:hypothetical protein
MKYSTRQLVTLAVFGALWGVVEITLGSILHALNVPLTGAFMAAIGLAIVISSKLFVPVRGSILFIGVIAMILKLFSIGSIVIGPMVGILLEALVAEGVFLFFSRPNRMSFILAGSLGVLWTLIQPFFTGMLLFGRQPLIVWLDLVDQGARIFGLASSAAVWIILILACVHLLIGGLAGWMAWSAGKTLLVRTGRRADSPVSV